MTDAKAFNTSLDWSPQEGKWAPVAFREAKTAPDQKIFWHVFSFNVRPVVVSPAFVHRKYKNGGFVG